MELDALSIDDLRLILSRAGTTDLSPEEIHRKHEIGAIIQSVYQSSGMTGPQVRNTLERILAMRQQRQERMGVQVSQSGQRQEASESYRMLGVLNKMANKFQKNAKRAAAKYVDSESSEREFINENVVLVLEKTGTDLDNAGRNLVKRRNAFLRAYDDYFSNEENIELEGELLADLMPKYYEILENQYNEINELRSKMELEPLPTLDYILGDLVVILIREEISNGNWDSYLEKELSQKRAKKFEDLVEKN